MALPYQNFVKYIIVILILFFLIKAFAFNCMNNTKIALLVVIIMFIILFIANQDLSCDKGGRKRNP